MATDDDIAIAVSNVSKCYSVYENQRARLRHALLPANTDGVSEVWALRDLSFEIKRGQSVGIIGRNGAGKSTLLEIITQTLTPTTGTVRVYGKVAALLELGSGFNPEYSGRENVFLNGLLMGLSRKDVEQRFDDILSFADIGDVLDRPVKSYSSGMLVRLAFAVQVALDPEILIVDEALSVGDYFFQQKCFGRLQQMRENGLTLLFVSHNMGTVRDICTHAIYIRQGVKAYEGESTEAIRLYLKDGRPDSKAPAQRSPEPATAPLQSSLLDNIRAPAIWSRATEAIARLVAVHFVDEADRHVNGVLLGSNMRVRVYLRLTGTELPIHIALALKNKYNQIIFSTNNQLLGIALTDAKGQAISVFEFSMSMAIEGGQYSLKISTNDPTTGDLGTRDDTGWIGPLQIDWNYEQQRAPFMGMFGIPTTGRALPFQ